MTLLKKPHFHLRQQQIFAETAFGNFISKMKFCVFEILLQK
jgi:hypothetical protein